MVRSSLLILHLAAALAAAQTVHVEGSVVNQSGTPIAKANVTLWGATKYTEFSDENGRFVFSVPPGTYSLYVSHAGFAVQKYGAHVPLEDSCDTDDLQHLQVDCIRRAPGLTLSLETGGV